MICENCGTKNENDAVHCKKCGKNLIKKEKKLAHNSNVMIIGTKNTSYETILEYKNLTSFYLFYQSEIKKIEKEMNKWNKTFVNKKDNVLVKDAMSKFVFMNSNGKYLRALLIALGYFIATKKDDNSYLPLAAAYETFQTAILVHDDVIDNAEIRRGKKTIHKKYFEKFDKYDLKDEFFEDKKNNTGNSIGICVGDIGFYISNNMIVESYMNHPNLGKVLKCYNDIVINTGKGELIDVVLPFNEQYNSKNKCLEKDILEIYNLKTSWYTIVGPCSLGMILGGNSERVIESVTKTLLLNFSLYFTSSSSFTILSKPFLIATAILAPSKSTFFPFLLTTFSVLTFSSVLTIFTSL